MKREPIKNIKNYGCCNCTYTLNVLSKETKLYNEFANSSHLMINNFSYDIPYKKFEDDEYCTVEYLEDRYKNELSNCFVTELFIMTPLHDETYEYNTKDKKWYLVNQGQGFA